MPFHTSSIKNLNFEILEDFSRPTQWFEDFSVVASVRGLRDLFRLPATDVSVIETPANRDRRARAIELLYTAVHPTIRGIWREYLLQDILHSPAQMLQTLRDSFGQNLPNQDVLRKLAKLKQSKGGLAPYYLHRAREEFESAVKAQISVLEQEEFICHLIVRGLQLDCRPQSAKSQYHTSVDALTMDLHDYWREKGLPN